MKRFYCTHIDCHNILKGIPLLESLSRHEKNNFTVFAVCIDRSSQNLLQQLGIPNVVVLSIEDIEISDHEILQYKNTHTRETYLNKISLLILLNLLRNVQEIDTLTYLDPNLYFHSSTEPLFQALAGGKILAVPCFSSIDKGKEDSKLELEFSLLSIRNEKSNYEILYFLLTEPNLRHQNNAQATYTESKIQISELSIRFPNIAISIKSEFAAAPWNHEIHSIRDKQAGSLTTEVSNHQAIFYDFRYLQLLNLGIYIPINNKRYCINKQIIEKYYIPYIDSVTLSILKLKKLYPNFNLGLIENINTTPLDTILIHNQILNKLDITNLVQKKISLDSEWTCFAGEQYKEELLQQNELQIIIKKELPKITIVTPSFNQAEFLKECIDSILSQNYPNLEYIIMDGGSTDNSKDILKQHEKYLKFWQSRPDGGQYKAIQEGFKISSGEIMAWLNSDDKYRPMALHTASAIFQERTDVRWLIGRCSGYDEKGNTTWVDASPNRYSRELYLLKLFDKPWIQQESVFWKRSLWEQAGSTLDLRFKLAADLELWRRFFRFAQLYSTNAVLSGFRSQANQRSKIFFDKYMIEANQIIDEEIKLIQEGLYHLNLASPDPIIV